MHRFVISTVSIRILQEHDALRVAIKYCNKIWQVTQLVRVTSLYLVGRGFKSYLANHKIINKNYAITGSSFY